MSIQVHYDDASPPLKCSSSVELDLLLDRLTADASLPILVDIRVPGFIVQIGLGLDPTFVIVNTGHENDGEYVVTVGDAKAEGMVEVYGCGTYSEMSRRNLVPHNMARDAVRHFVDSGVLSASVCWNNWAGKEVTQATWRPTTRAR